MKKILILAMIFGINSALLAEDPVIAAKATLSISSVAGADDAVYLFESNDFTAAKDDDYDVTKMMNDVTSSTKVVNFFAVASWGNASVMGEASLDGIKLKFQANKIDNDPFTITFSDVEGKQYFLKDNMVKSVVDPTKDSVMAIVDKGTYTFTQVKETTEERFEIVKDGPTNLNKVAVAPAKARKALVNGQLVIIRDEKVFSVAGAER